MATAKKDYFTSREAAKLLGVAVSTVQLWTNNGVLRAWTTGGGHRRIDRNSVQEILRQRKEAMHVPQRGHPLSIVLVEDNAQQIRLYEKQFRMWGTETQVFTATDGYQGLIMIGRVLPDVIITDLMMPNVDGFQMIRALKEIPDLEHSEIIVVTGLTKEEVETRGGLPKGVHLFSKPFSFREVEKLLRQKEREKAA